MLSDNPLPYSIIKILWDHRRIWGPSLTETSLCGAYLYLFISNAIEIQETHSHSFWYGSNSDRTVIVLQHKHFNSWFSTLCNSVTNITNCTHGNMCESNNTANVNSSFIYFQVGLLCIISIPHWLPFSDFLLGLLQVLQIYVSHSRW